MKSKRQLLQERLQRFKRNSQEMMKRMDKKMQDISNLKDNINSQTQKLTKWQQDYKNVLAEMGERMLGIKIKNHPLRQPTDSRCIIPEIKSISYVVERIMNAQQICILTGAGISKKSGIPTFRGEDGLYKNQFRNKQNQRVSPQQFLTLKNFNQNPQLVWNWYNEFQKLLIQKKPCQNHQYIHKIANILGKKGKKVTIVTTNIDNFHNQVYENSKWYKIQQIHGNIKYKLCLKCNYKMVSKESFFCQECKYKQCRPNIMFFDEKYGQIFGKEVKDKKYKFTICIGTSLQTGLSFKIVCQAEQIVQINPKCVIKTGKVYKFEEDCEQILKKLIEKIEQVNE